MNYKITIRKVKKGFILPLIMFFQTIFRSNSIELEEEEA